ncbi:hypothetical protein CS0771_46020 [Catellatospora sp. IY07-71]|nr:hypothetical protein CS0771_46020 [Catellatospora sp. IY07-71]
MNSAGDERTYPPINEQEPIAISDPYLSEDERVMIADLRRAGHSIRARAARGRVRRATRPRVAQSTSVQRLVVVPWTIVRVFWYAGVNATV